MSTLCLLPNSTSHSSGFCIIFVSLRAFFKQVLYCMIGLILKVKLLRNFLCSYDSEFSPHLNVA